MARKHIPACSRLQTGKAWHEVPRPVTMRAVPAARLRRRRYVVVRGKIQRDGIRCNRQEKPEGNEQERR